MFKFIVIGVVILLLGLLVAEPMMSVGKRISKKIRAIGKDTSESEEE